MTLYSRRQSKSRMSAASASAPSPCFPLGKLHFTKIPVWRISKILHWCLLNQIIISSYNFTSGQKKICKYFTLTFRWRACLLGKDSIYFALLTDVTVDRQAGLNFSMHFLRNRCWQSSIIGRYMFGPVVDSISIAQTWVTILYLAYFLLTFLHYSLKLRQALRLG